MAGTSNRGSRRKKSKKLSPQARNLQMPLCPSSAIHFESAVYAVVPGNVAEDNPMDDSLENKVTNPMDELNPNARIDKIGSNGSPMQLDDISRELQDPEVEKSTNHAKDLTPMKRFNNQVAEYTSLEFPTANESSLPLIHSSPQVIINGYAVLPSKQTPEATLKRNSWLVESSASQLLHTSLYANAGEWHQHKTDLASREEAAERHLHDLALRGIDLRGIEWVLPDLDPWTSESGIRYGVTQVVHEAAPPDRDANGDTNARVSQLDGLDFTSAGVQLHEIMCTPSPCPTRSQIIWSSPDTQYAICLPGAESNRLPYYRGPIEHSSLWNYYSDASTPANIAQISEEEFNFSGYRRNDPSVMWAHISNLNPIVPEELRTSKLIIAEPGLVSLPHVLFAHEMRPTLPEGLYRELLAIQARLKELDEARQARLKENKRIQPMITQKIPGVLERYEKLFNKPAGPFDYDLKRYHMSPEYHSFTGPTNSYREQMNEGQHPSRLHVSSEYHPSGPPNEYKESRNAERRPSRPFIPSDYHSCGPNNGYKENMDAARRPSRSYVPGNGAPRNGRCDGNARVFTPRRA